MDPLFNQHIIQYVNVSDIDARQSYSMCPFITVKLIIQSDNTDNYRLDKGEQIQINNRQIYRDIKYII